MQGDWYIQIIRYLNQVHAQSEIGSCTRQGQPEEWTECWVPKHVQHDRGPDKTVNPVLGS